MKLCKDCANYRSHSELDCVRPTDEISPVTGERITIKYMAWHQREKAWSFFSGRRCGPDAIYFEPKDRSLPPRMSK